MKLKLVVAAIAALVLSGAWAIAVSAQDDAPPPYAGMKNPFPWDNSAIQEAGKKVYTQSCLGCHGAKGDNLPGSNFASPEFHQKVESHPDTLYWIISEGALSRGMPGFKASLSEEKRWHLVTYLWSLGKEAPPAQTETPPDTSKASLQLESRVGQSIVLMATLRDDQNRPLKDETVKFFLRASFFASDKLMEIGDARTGDDGVAAFEYDPTDSGNLDAVARFRDIEAKTTVSVDDSDMPPYIPHAGVDLPAGGPEVFVGPLASRQLNQANEAPFTALRLPGGLLSWLLVPAVALAVIWGTYLRTMFHVLRLPSVRSGQTGMNSKLTILPFVGILVIAAVGMLLVLMIVTGPYTHLHLASR